MNTPEPQRLLTEAEAAKYLCMSAQFLRQARAEGSLRNRTPGPPFIRFGRAVRYRLADLEEWVERHRVARRAG